MLPGFVFIIIENYYQKVVPAELKIDFSSMKPSKPCS